MAALLPPPFPLLIIRLKPSMRLAVVLGLAHFFTIGLLWPLMLPIAVKLMGTALLTLSLVFYVRHYALLRSPSSVVGLELSDEMTCTVETRRGDHISCTLLGSSFVAPYLTVLELKPLDSPMPRRSVFSRSITVLPDGIDADEFRQLRVLLRWKWRDLRDPKMQIRKVENRGKQ